MVAGEEDHQDFGVFEIGQGISLSVRSGKTEVRGGCTEWESKWHGSSEVEE
jgi:hypothetical protein